MCSRRPPVLSSQLAAPVAALAVAAGVAGCSLGGVVSGDLAGPARAAENCRPSPSDPGVLVCQRGEEIRVVGGQEDAVAPGSAVLEAIDVDRIPVAARPRVVVERSTVSACASGPGGNGALALSCRLDLTLRVD